MSTFGETTEGHLIRLRQICANQEDVRANPAFCSARILKGFHYYNSDDPTRKTVESENIKKTCEFAVLYNKPLVHLKAMHMPVAKHATLCQISGKQFEGLLPNFLACTGVPLLLLTNIAPQFGLFNGAICTFKGLIYSHDDAEVTLHSSILKRMTFDKLELQTPIDLKSEDTPFKQFHQLPVGSILKTINCTPVTSHDDINILTVNDESVKCTFKLPKCPPTLPDFIVVECDAYKNRGGPNILGFAGAENLIPIPLTKVQYAAGVKSKATKTNFGYRIGFKVEAASVVTVFKAQGRTENTIMLEIKDHVKVPGLWYVALSRTVHPKHIHIPEGEWPSAMDINVQRLNPFVNEAKLFTRAVKIQSEKTMRKWSVGKGNKYGQCWSDEECQTADAVAMAYRHKYRTNLPSIMKYITDKYSKGVPKFFSEQLVQRVINKMDNTYESLLKKEAPYIKDDEYRRLTEYQKHSGKPSKAKQ